VLKFLLVVALFAALVYALMWSIERRRAAGASGGSVGRPRPPFKRRPRPKTKQVAPDDDEDFLRWLDRKRKNDKNPPSDA